MRLLKAGSADLTSGKDGTMLLKPPEERICIAQALGLAPMTDKE